MRHYQRITVTTITAESADTLFAHLARNGVQNGFTVPSFTIHADERFTVSGYVRVELGNGPLDNVLHVISRYLSEIVAYRNEAADCDIVPCAYCLADTYTVESVQATGLHFCKPSCCRAHFELLGA